MLDFRNCWLVEQPNGDFAPDHGAAIPVLDLAADAVRAAGRLDATKTIAAIAAKAVKEVAYHRELAAEWVIRLGDGTEESARRMADGLDWCWRFVPELFEMDDVLDGLIARGIGADPRSFRDDYRRRSAPCWPRRRSRRRPTSARSSAAGAAITASISAICWR